MNTAFRSKRFFHDSEGWHVTLRPADELAVRRMPVPGRRAAPGIGLVVGPFDRRRDLEHWFGRFLDLYGVARFGGQRQAA